MNEKYMPLHSEGLEQCRLLGYSSSETVYFRGFFPSSDPRSKSDAGRKTSRIDDLDDWESEGRGVYVVVNGFGHSDSQISEGRAIFYEHDSLSIDIQIDLWKRLGLPQPTFQVDTGGKSIHSYWVLGEGMPVAEWKSLQSDLLEFADADRSIKNPSRVMRLAGYRHPETGKKARIINISGQKYSKDLLRSTIPTKRKSEQRPIVQQTIGAFPIPKAIAKSNREILDNGVGEGERNSTGYKLATDLIGVENWLILSGYPYERSARNLFDQFCDRCNPSLDDRERETIWAQASSLKPTPSLSGDKLINCYKAWEKSESPPTPKEAKPLKKAAKETPKTEKPEKLDFNGKMTKIAAIEEEFGFQTAQYNHEMHEFAKSLGYQKTVLESIYFQHLSESMTTEFKKLGEYDRPNEDREWIIADLVPKGSTMLVYADGGVGKTLLLYDLIDSIYREKSFLGHPVVERVRASIIQTDEPENDFKERMAEKGMYDLDIFANIQWSFGAVRQLEDHIIRDQIGIVLIDSFASNSKFASTEEKDAAHAAVLYRLRDVAQRQNCTIIVVHHANKSGAARGSTAIRNNVSEVWNLRRPNKDLASEQKILHNERILDCEKSRSGVTLKYVIAISETLDWEYIGDLRKIEEKQQNEPATIPEKLKAFFMANSDVGVTINQIITSPLFMDDDRAVIKTSLHRLKKKGYLKGIPSPGADTVWSLQNNPILAQKSCYSVTPNAESYIEQGKTGVTLPVTQSVTPEKNVTASVTPVAQGKGVTGEVTGSVTPLEPIDINGSSVGCNAVTQISYPREAESFSEISEEGDLLSRRNSSTKKGAESSRAPLASYTGPGIGDTVRFVYESLSVAERAALRKKGTEYPWGRTGQVTAYSAVGNGYAVTVVSDGKTFVIKNLLAIELAKVAAPRYAPESLDIGGF
jgi:hypothetical protein